MPDPKLVALVPMRHQSERVPNKNHRLLGGRPLYTHIVETLLSVPEIELIVIDTDSELIWQGVSRDYPAVKLLDRPQDLRDGEIPMNRIIKHDLKQVQAQVYLQTHSTNPLIRATTISAAIDAFKKRGPSFDSLFSVTRMQVRLWDRHGKPINHDPAELAPTQELAPIFAENSCVYIFERPGFLKSGNRIGAHPLMFEIDPLEAWDIDTEQDFEAAELLVRAMRNSSGD